MDSDMASLNTTINPIKATIKLVLSENDQLKTRVAELEKKVKELEMLRNSIVIGQVASKVEKTLIDHILVDSTLTEKRCT